VSESIDAAVWREHEAWLERRARLRVERARWSEADWEAAKRMAVAAWERDQGDLFLFCAQRALEEQHCRRVDARLAVEARHDADWLADVLQRTAL
jgi:hypothetical protein